MRFLPMPFTFCCGAVSFSSLFTREGSSDIRRVLIHGGFTFGDAASRIFRFRDSLACAADGRDLLPPELKVPGLRWAVRTIQSRLVATSGCHRKE